MIAVKKDRKKNIFFIPAIYKEATELAEGKIAEKLRSIENPLILAWW
jgi:hypothetical protein